MQWNAQWIWLPKAGNESNFYLYARREFDLAAVPPEATVFVTAGSLYKLYVNGEYVGRGPNPSDPSRYYYDVHPVSGRLKPGPNVVALIAYTYGPTAAGVIGQNWGRGGALLELRAPGRDGAPIVTTDKTWRVFKAPPWDQAASLNCNLLGDYKEDYDSRKEIDGWMNAGFDDSRWSEPDLLGRPPVQPWATLVEREIPFLVGERVAALSAQWESASVTYAWRDDWEIYHEQRLAPLSFHRGPRDIEKPVLVKKTHDDFSPALTLDFGRDVTGYLEIRIADSKGGIVDLLYAEDAYFVRVDRFTLRGGPQILQPFNRRTFRRVKLVFVETPDTIEIADITLQMSTYPANSGASSFVCSDDRLNRIYEVAKYTMRISMLDHFVDCPWRERTLYGGDHYAENLIAQYSFGDPRMNRKCLRQMFHLQYDEGALPPYGPYGGCDGFYPSWSAFFGLAFVDHYRFTGDRAFLDELWPRFEKLAEWAIREMSTNAYGLIGTPEHGGKFSDWMRAPKVRFDAWSNFPFQRMLEGAALLARARDNERAAARYDAAAKAMADTLLRHLVDSETKTVVTAAEGARGPRHGGQFDTALPLWCGIADPTLGLRMARMLFDPAVSRIVSPFHGLFLVEGLFAYDEDIAAIDFIRRFWGAILDLGEGTMFEHFSLGWPVGGATDRQNSHCHGWSAAPAYSLPANVLGVQPLEPAFTSIRIKLQPGDLVWASGTVPTPQGPVRVSWQRSDHRLRIECDLPSTVRATVVLPPYRGRDRIVFVNGGQTVGTLDNGRRTVQIRGGRHLVEQIEQDIAAPPRVGA